MPRPENTDADITITSSGEFKECVGQSNQASLLYIKLRQLFRAISLPSTDLTLLLCFHTCNVLVFTVLTACFSWIKKSTIKLQFQFYPFQNDNIDRKQRAREPPIFHAPVLQHCCLHRRGIIWYWLGRPA